jgi:transcriptional regulator with XRE-family HTH domain
MITLQQYIEKKGITTQKFSNITGVSYSYLAKIKRVENPHTTIDVIVKIFNGTKAEFGEGLTAREWLDLPNAFTK